VSKLSLAVVRTGRECGDCQACCTAKSVPGIVKLENGNCPHQCDTGCSIHADRPQQCRDYRCLWLQGHLDDELRPDQSGYILDVALEQSTQKHFFTALPAWPGAFEDEKVVYRLKKLAKKVKNPVIANGLGMIAELGWKYTIDKTFAGVEVIYV
jgi:hypothetical protein